RVDLSLEGRAALISGGGTGIGYEIARRLGRAGAAVAIAGRRREVVAAAAAELEEAGCRALAVRGDVSVPGDCRRMVAETVAAFDGLDILVNNAAVYRGGALAEVADDEIDAVVDIDLKGPIRLSQAALPILRAGSGERSTAILNVSSSVTISPVPGLSVYAAAKAGLEMLTRSWALELAADRIRVNAIAAGVVRTPIFETVMPAADVAGFLDGFAASVPLGRVGEPDDVARLALFLCSPAAEWLTGAIVPLDGGSSLAGG
ncbi:MAG: glucose 1-dehydrogenase, partial [Thermoanaerobaculia bacterium]|nr:glucose 1-dehydrogenase [Thermoanaerobaculia bacterium]